MNVVSKEYIIKKLALEFDKNKLVKPAIEYTDVHGMRVTKVIDLAIMPTVSEFIAKLEEDLRTLNHEVIIDNDDLFVFRITVVGPGSFIDKKHNEMYVVKKA